MQDNLICLNILCFQIVTLTPHSAGKRVRTFPICEILFNKNGLQFYVINSFINQVQSYTESSILCVEIIVAYKALIIKAKSYVIIFVSIILL